jgi:flagellar motor switch protein FliN/FliY
MLEMPLPGMDSVIVDVSVVLGSKTMPIKNFIALSRGATIVLDPVPGDKVDIMANDHLVARGVVLVRGDTISVEVREILRSA